MAQGHKNLFNGLDLAGWKADDEAKKHWQANDWVLHCNGNRKDILRNELLTQKEYGPAEFIVDVRFPKEESKFCTITLGKNRGSGHEVRFELSPDGSYSIVELFGDSSTVRGPRNSRDSNPRIGIVCASL